MLTAAQVHEVIKQISANSSSGKPPIYIETIAERLAADRKEVRLVLEELRQLGFIINYINSSDIILLTELGKATVIIAAGHEVRSTADV